jgi:transketolase C-terminal domain/subunit
MNNVEAVRTTLHEALKSDERTLILGEDVGARGNVFLITKGFIEEFGPERVIDTPLAEASIVGIAVGMAMEGCARSPRSNSPTSSIPRSTRSSARRPRRAIAATATTRVRS